MVKQTPSRDNARQACSLGRKTDGPGDADESADSANLEKRHMLRLAPVER